ncbi:ABC transporter permease [Olivibacter sitiensis]|uniref:ABC transporter permease n=1 Tax=Olivibacter sitiensis TaxID=376470 RepID=UPI0003FD6D24|nr:ABC transporter permease [Olivibacter sitiensis]
MTIKIILSNLFYRPAHTVLSILLLLFGVGLISFLLLLQHRLADKLTKDMQGIDLVLGAKGSPLQLVLSAIYQLDAPTGNISVEEAERIRKHPMVAMGIPLAYGDSYRSFKIVGTTKEYLERYQVAMREGDVFEEEMEAVIGSDVARKSGLKLGDHFHGTHGTVAGGHVHEEYAYVVKGILAPSGRVVDQLILTDIPSVWKLHHEKHDHDEVHDHEDAGHVHEDHEEEKEITAMLLSLRSPMGAAILPRMVSDNTDMQAVSPSLEITKLLQIVGIGTTAIQGIAIGIIAIAIISVIISLYNRVNERMYELALARVMGGSRYQVGFLVLAEGVVLTLLGLFGGLLISRLAFWVLTHYSGNRLVLNGNVAQLVPNELLLIASVLVIGVSVSLIPAVKAYFINLSKILSHE